MTAACSFSLLPELRAACGARWLLPTLCPAVLGHAPRSRLPAHGDRAGGKNKGYEKIFEEIIVENFPNMEKEIVNQVQEAQRVPYWINPRRSKPRHILIKLTKPEHKEIILKAAREKQQVTYKGNPIHLTVYPSAETLQARR